MDNLEFLNNFVRNRFRVCRECGQDEIAYRINVNYYCDGCFNNNHTDETRFIYDSNYSECLFCGELDTYGKVYNDRFYSRACKKCFTDEVNDFLNPVCDIKPAKR
jgi:hypothetical protein